MKKSNFYGRVYERLLSYSNSGQSGRTTSAWFASISLQDAFWLQVIAWQAHIKYQLHVLLTPSFSFQLYFHSFST